MAELGRLERVDLRTAWESEAQDFTPWLAQDENIAILAETLGLELEVEEQEASVGPFSADILCRDTGSLDGESWVLVENQLERTDHRHLGQLLTYAAGLHTVTIIWIAQRFTDEHRAALDWLNEITGERFEFFGLEVELWKIGNSLAAPKFNIVSKPNEWSRGVATRASGGVDSPKDSTRRRFWSAFHEYLAAQNSPLITKTRNPRIYADYRIGRRDLHIGGSLNNDGIRAFAYFLPPNAEAHLRILERDRNAIEQEIGAPMRWRAGKKNASIRLIGPLQADWRDESDWPRQHALLAEMLHRFDRTFRPRVVDLDASDWEPDDIDDEDE